jgi:hypothetical protein
MYSQDTYEYFEKCVAATLASAAAFRVNTEIVLVHLTGGAAALEHKVAFGVCVDVECHVVMAAEKLWEQSAVRSAEGSAAHCDGPS